jgi:hypothetical protein
MPDGAPIHHLYSSAHLSLAFFGPVAVYVIVVWFWFS